MLIHQGSEGKPSKSEFMFFAKQASYYRNTTALPRTWTPTTALEFSRTYDAVDLSPIIIDPMLGTCMTFTNHFPYLGSIFDVNLSDLADVVS